MMTPTAATSSSARSRLHPRHLQLAVLNMVGGLAVLGSYYAGLASHDGAASALWGGLPESLRPIYTVTMFAAAAGYFPFTYQFLFAVDPDRVRIAGGFGYGLLLVLYGLILVPSALWLPLTFALLDGWNPLLWLAIRFVLLLVGVGSLGLLASLILLRPKLHGPGYGLAIAGAVAFCIQTALLDATVWPAFFLTDRIPGL